MRITSEVLLRLADDFVERRLRVERDILAIYLHGSVLSAEPALEGTTDIDLFFIHLNPVQTEREIERITDDIHFDVVHQIRRVYNQTLKLRTDPWMGPVVNSCRIVHDPQHFLDFIQAGVRSQFDRPENILARSRQHQEQARRIWLDFQMELPEPGPDRFSRYLDAVNAAAQSIALLTGHPLTERRMLGQFVERAAAIEKPGMAAGLNGLLGGARLGAGKLKEWLPKWEETFRRLPAEKTPVRLQSQRFNYYMRAFEHFVQEGQEQLALWPLLRTWTDMAIVLNSSSPQAEGSQEERVTAAWQEVTEELELSGDAFDDRLAALDAFLDVVDETLDTWGRVRGI